METALPQDYYGRALSNWLIGLGTEAVGTGPYKLDHWTQGEEIVLIANEDYWRTEPAWEDGPTGAPALKKIIIKLVDEFSIGYPMLQSGDADTISTSAQADWSQMDELVGMACEDLDNCNWSEFRWPWCHVSKRARADIFFTRHYAVAAATSNQQCFGHGIPGFGGVHIARRLLLDTKQYLEVCSW
jgi:peptide/nickel transport system substrate-binding protein